MSLKDLAEKVKAEGRHGDTELVHMTKGEVAGLQALAESAGGSLTINPKTGQPEAFFLAALLPTLLGGAGAAMGLTAAQAALLGAGVGALSNRDNPLMGALTGGLGGFGGAGLASGLGLLPEAASAVTAAPAAASAAAPVSTSIIPAAPASSITPAMSPTVTAPISTSIVPAAAPSSITASTAPAATTLQTTAQAAGAPAMTGSQLLNSGLMALTPAMMPRGMGSAGLPGEEEDTEDLMGRYEYRANPTGGTRTPGSAFTGERVFFQPEYRRMFAAKGGEVKKYADGGVASATSSNADPARGMTGESREAMQYLNSMGQGPGSSGEALDYLYGRVPAVTKAVQAPVQQAAFIPPTRMRSTISNTDGYGLIGSGEYAGLYQSARPQYVFDPGSQQYFRTDPVFNYVAPVAATYSSYDYGGGGGDYGGFGGFGGFGDSGGGDSGAGVGDSGPSGSSGDGGASAAGPGDSWRDGGSIYAAGGIAELARGGMKAGGFVVPADVVSMVGEGNTDAGYERIKRMLPGATPIKGKDGGQADTVKTSIEGKQPARIAHGEMYVPPAAVKRAGGAKKLYAMMDKVRKQATGNKKQIKPVNLKKALA